MDYSGAPKRPEEVVVPPFHRTFVRKVQIPSDWYGILIAPFRRPPEGRGLTRLLKPLTTHSPLSLSMLSAYDAMLCCACGCVGSRGKSFWRKLTAKRWSLSLSAKGSVLHTYMRRARGLLCAVSMPDLTANATLFI